MIDPDSLATLDDAAAVLGVELRDEGVEGYVQPYHCGQRMRVKKGIIGPDYARCEVCGAELRCMASPHVNGGVVVSPEWLDAQGDRLWVAMDRDGNLVGAPGREGAP
jgi:hypothetical protein